MTTAYHRTRPPPTEALAIAYLSPLLAPTPVGARLPRPAETEDTIAGFLRVEAAGGVMRPDEFLWDVSVILHAYAPNTQESMAERLIDDAIFWALNAEGTTTVMSNGDRWYVTYARCPALAARKADPMVALTRYRAMVTWRMPGIGVLRGQAPPAFARLDPQAAVTAGGQAQRAAAMPGTGPRPARQRTSRAVPRI